MKTLANALILVGIAGFCWMQLDTWREVRKATAFIEAMHELVMKGEER